MCTVVVRYQIFRPLITSNDTSLPWPEGRRLKEREREREREGSSLCYLRGDGYIRLVSAEAVRASLLRNKISSSGHFVRRFEDQLHRNSISLPERNWGYQRPPLSSPPAAWPLLRSLIKSTFVTMFHYVARERARARARSLARASSAPPFLFTGKQFPLYYILFGAMVLKLPRDSSL